MFWMNAAKQDGEMKRRKIQKQSGKKAIADLAGYKYYVPW